MAKQIKIGLDKVPAPVTKQFTQLVDIEGTLLFDAAGNPLVTEEEAALSSFTSSGNSLSVHVNNKPLDGGTIPVIEQFADTSAVSSSLLGVPRAEEQLSLFSDVATYGLDEEQWNEYSFSDATHPRQWYRKENPVYGRRQNPRFYEGSQEQALYLKAFPSQFTYPGGTKEEKKTDPDPVFRQYMNFIALGRWFYNEFKDANFDFAEKFFLGPNAANVVDRDDNIMEYDLDTETYSEAVLSQNGDFFDVTYGEEQLQDSFDAIERWTYFFDKLKANEEIYPDPVSIGELPFKSKIENYSKIRSFCTQECRPGGFSGGQQIGILESKRAFRYQPGRASGFTFGARMNSDPISTASILEWGCSNETDEYMFQLRGSQFNIVRRSTIKMPDELLTRQGLLPEDQTEDPVFPRGIGSSVAQYETVIPRSKMNGDALNGIGESGYILSFEEVTMYKIEFSWYGAIGAKFYAYVPIGNGECRWVLMHTLVIENGLGEPCLANPDFKFKYLLYCEDTATLKQPIYLYKYGSSYYVDGGDEGTIRLSGVSSDKKSFRERTPVIGVLPKNYIFNSDGIGVRNYKKSYPSLINVSSDTRCRVDIEEIIGSPLGVHYGFSPSIHMDGENPRTRSLDFRYSSSSNLQILQPDDPSITSITVTNASDAFSYTGMDAVIGDSVSISGTEYEIQTLDGNSSSGTGTFTENFNGTSGAVTTAIIVKRLNARDNNGHLKADGVYGVYVNSNFSISGQSTNILSREKDTYRLVASTVNKTIKTDGSIIDPDSNPRPEFSAKVQNYHTVVASEVPIYSDEFKIHFLNPQAKSDIGPVNQKKHFAEFAVSVTPHKPTAPSGSGTDLETKFEFETDQFKKFELGEYPFVEYCHRSVEWDSLEGAGVREIDFSYGDQMSVDPRLDEELPQGVDSGYHSCVRGRVQVASYSVQSIESPANDGSEFGSFYKLIFSSQEFGPSDSLITFDSSGNGTSEVGFNFTGTGKFFESTVFRPLGENNYVYVSAGNGTTGQTVDADIVDDADGNKSIQTKTLRLFHNWQAVSYDANGNEKFTDNKFSFSQAIKFNDQPLYPVFALADGAKVNGVVIEEVSADGSVRTHTPKFITDDSTYNPSINITNSGGASSIFAPPAFNSKERLASCMYDLSAQNPLRPGNVLFSFYVDANKPIKVDLEDIFNVDRKGVSRGLLNNKAIYFNATSLEGGETPTAGNIEATLTVKEQ
jgi:hypothetical protein